MKISQVQKQYYLTKIKMTKYRLFKLGNHYLINGDSTSMALGLILKDILRDEKISLQVCDVPYGVSYVESNKAVSAKHKKIANDDMDNDMEYQMFTQKWLEVVRPYLADTNSYYIFNSDKMYIPLVNGIKASGYKYSQLLIWVKNQAVLGRLDFHCQHELIAYGWYGKHEFYKTNDRSVLQCPKPQKNNWHPTQKPLSILRRLIMNSSKVDDFVYDCFGGSGSTLLACEQTKRKCIMVELDSEYCDVIMKRFEKLTGVKPIECLINSYE